MTLADTGGPRAALAERWYRLRDRLFASPDFHSFAARFPLMRPVARRKARALFDLCAGFTYSQVLLACVQLDLFEVLARGARDIDDLADDLDLPAESAERLINAAVSLRLLSRSGSAVRLGELGAALRGTPGLQEMIGHHAMLYRDLADPVALLRDPAHPTETSRYWAYTDRENAAAVDSGSAATYSSLMGATQRYVAEEVLDAYRVARHRHLLDIGGGDGTFVMAAARRAPELRLTLFDLPSVAGSARTRFETAGLSRVEAVGGSFFDDPLPEGADLITLVRVLYDHDDDSVLRILRAARAAIAPGGVLLIAEPMAETRGAEPMGHAYFGFYLLAMHGGRPRSVNDLNGLLADAGFGDVRPLRLNRPILTGALTARPS